MADSDNMRIPGELAQQFRDPKWGASQLSGISILKGFTVEELETLYGIGEVISLKPNSYAVIEGEPTRGLYVILYGTVSVYKNEPISGAMHRIAYLDQGANFGELSLFDQAPRSASVAAEAVCHLFHLDADVFATYLTKAGEGPTSRFYKACAEELVSRFRKLNTDYITSQQQLWKYAFTKDKQADESAAEAS